MLMSKKILTSAIWGVYKLIAVAGGPIQICHSSDANEKHPPAGDYFSW